MEVKVIAKIKTDFPTKFGVPRQSGLACNKSYIVFEKDYRQPEALRGIENFSHLWLIFHFDKADKKQYTPTVRPPKLGGNKRIGVFATRSPYRPNPIGLSLVKLVKVVETKEGLVLEVEGADLVDGTPILDIKPYLPFVESVPSANGAYTEETSKVRLYVDFPQFLLEKIDENHRAEATTLLSLDPRPGYHDDPERVYGMNYIDYDIKFKVANDTLTVVSVEKIKN